MVTSHENPVLHVPRDKMGCGFNHFDTAHALCHCAYSYSFDNEDRYMTKLHFFNFYPGLITSGEVELTADQFPNFLYDVRTLYHMIWMIGMWRKGCCIQIFVCGDILSLLFFMIIVKCIFMGIGLWAPPIGRRNHWSARSTV
jgi:hypothetical protein